MQTSAVYLKSATISLKFPSPETEVLPGIYWGAIDDFPSPAYWDFQVLARRVEGMPIKYRLGSTLKEETAACLLGGHGIPAKIGVAAFTYLQEQGAFGAQIPSESELLEMLSTPLKIDGREVKYRFARQKSRYLYGALQKLAFEQAPLASGKLLRDWLLAIPGIGYKTASWIARNWLDADDVAILDIHIYRAGLLGGFFFKEWTVEKHYLELEEQFVNISRGLGVRASELDAVIWLEMMSSPSTVHRSMKTLGDFQFLKDGPNLLSGAQQGKTYANQLAMCI